MSSLMVRIFLTLLLVPTLNAAENSLWTITNETGYAVSVACVSITLDGIANDSVSTGVKHIDPLGELTHSFASTNSDVIAWNTGTFKCQVSSPTLRSGSTSFATNNAEQVRLKVGKSCCGRGRLRITKY